MSHFRTGNLRLEIETRRYVPILNKNLRENRKRTANERLCTCKPCRLNAIENEYQVIVNTFSEYLYSGNVT